MLKRTKNQSASKSCSKRSPRTLGLETVEKRQLMAADLAVVDAPVEVPAAAAEVIAPAVVRIEAATRPTTHISNGFPAPQSPALAIEAAREVVFAQFQQSDDDDLSGQGNDVKPDYSEYIQGHLEEMMREIREKLAANMPEIYAPSATSLDGEEDGDGDGVPDGAYGPRR